MNNSVSKVKIDDYYTNNGTSFCDLLIYLDDNSIIKAKAKEIEGTWIFYSADFTTRPCPNCKQIAWCHCAKKLLSFPDKPLNKFIKQELMVYRLGDPFNYWSK
ncbi:hypothetical protein G7L40_20575 [Paenibacillus polymyxa]|uniref:Uncharacterized protein n=1 Tax=Paenibacillus polymyxa TaxID=1406 RepID=A0A378XZ26_PAEPO|nr:hypothetical protein [Paenibacillus polymyxa]MBE7896114.1 hypothetical protein [Paenibacillus polymyxa]MBG9765940.1 hypothetical protein [Paenibacillus polymyxa]MCC3256644.1 hypothetical protein [Paenibacillus polymyxa]QPK54865.1 hypothetical protein G7035_20620 [Paenibacillus polymyxa]QPK59955.1 hypothetical protein G7L40_20575 [Paenibacillus polymyxa]